MENPVFIPQSSETLSLALFNGQLVNLDNLDLDNRDAWED